MNPIVSLYAGAATAQAIRFELPADKQDLTVAETIAYGLEKAGQTASQDRLVAAVQNEMRRTYGITANDATVKASATIGQYITNQNKEGINYQGVNLVVAANQTGGSRGGLEFALDHGRR